jgi:hypothetical protein
MAYGDNKLSRAIELGEMCESRDIPIVIWAYLIGQSNIRLVGREVHDWTTSTNVKYRCIISGTNSAEGLCVLEERLDSGVVQKAFAFIVILKQLQRDTSL